MKRIILCIISIVSLVSFSICDKNCSINEKNIQTSDNEVLIENVDLKKLEGKYVVYTMINCGPCNAEYKEIEKINKRFGGASDIVIVTLPNFSKEKVSKHFLDNGYTFSRYYDENKNLLDILKINTVPRIYKFSNNIFKEFKYNYLTLDTYYEVEKFNVDKEVRAKLKDIEVYSNTLEKLNLINILPENALIIYGAPYCKDCVKEYERLNNIKGERELVYLIDGKRYTKEEFLEYAKDKKNIYYVETTKIREEFNINWIPSVTEVKNGLFTGPFIRNDEYKFE